MSMMKSARKEFEKRYEQLEEELKELELKTLNAKYRSLESRDAAARTLRGKVQDLKARAAEGKQKASQFADESSGAWEKFRAGMENAWEELRTSVSDAREEFEETFTDEDGNLDASGAACSSHTTDGKTTTASPSMAASGQCSPQSSKQNCH